MDKVRWGRRLTSTLLVFAVLPCARGRSRLQPLPITERDDDLDLSLSSRPGHPSPPQQHVVRPQHVGTTGAEFLKWQPAAIEARTRVTVAATEAGGDSLQVKMSAGFHAGQHIVINPGGPSEEQNTFLRSPFVLSKPLMYQHGLGEIVIQLGDPPSTTATETSIRDNPQPWVAAAMGQKEPPLLGSMTELRSRTEGYVQRHWGVEAAAALLAAVVLVVVAATCVVQAFCEYNLFCFLRRTKAPRSGGTQAEAIRRSSFDDMHELGRT